MSDYLFVYGTLMRKSRSLLGRDQRRRLMREATFIGPAQTYGTMYDLGAYPGVVVDHEMSRRVSGELLRLRSPAATLQWLDVYEGIAPGDLDPDYRRAIRPVTYGTTRACEAWVYVYQAPVAVARRVADGVWRG
ncbi:MAG: gamma-glutamylcyclotransferase family protein [Pseudomonadota bacterium]